MREGRDLEDSRYHIILMIVSSYDRYDTLTVESLARHLASDIKLEFKPSQAYYHTVEGPEHKVKPPFSFSCAPALSLYECTSRVLSSALSSCFGRRTRTRTWCLVLLSFFVLRSTHTIPDSDFGPGAVVRATARLFAHPSTLFFLRNIYL